MREAMTYSVREVKYPREVDQADFDKLLEHISTVVWGNPIRLGPRRIHIYGTVKRLWKPVNVELRQAGATLLSTAYPVEERKIALDATESHIREFFLESKS